MPIACLKSYSPVKGSPEARQAVKQTMNDNHPSPKGLKWEIKKKQLTEKADKATH